MLGVEHDLVKTHGVVSGPVAREMAVKALAHSRVDLALGITGWAGPDRGSDSQPVGTVWVGLALRRQESLESIALCRQFKGPRSGIQRKSSRWALESLMNFWKRQALDSHSVLLDNDNKPFVEAFEPPLYPYPKPFKS